MTIKLISSTILVDGQIQVIPADVDAPTTEPVEPVEDVFDQFGMSDDAAFGVAVRIKSVDLFVKSIENGDEFEKAVAAKALKHGVRFAMVLPGRPGFERGGDLFNLVHFNRPQSLQFASGWQGAMMFRPFYPEHKEPIKPNSERGPKADGILTPVLGFDPRDDWESAGESYIAQLKRDITRRRNTRPGAPIVSPGRP
jgi:hypothetical protein